MELCLKNCKIVDSNKTFTGDIYIKDGIIEELGEHLEKACRTVDVCGRTVMPAFVDLHAHFRDPGFTHKEDIKSGSKAAAKGGYTMVNLMPNTTPVCFSMDTVQYVLEKAKEVGLIDIHQAVAITKDFSGKGTYHLDKLDTNLVKAISEDGHDVMSSQVMLEGMQKAKEKNFIVMCHCEDSSLSQIDMRLAEDLMTWRNIELAKVAKCHLHLCHVSTVNSMKYFIEAKKSGQKITCEVTPHHIALDSSTSYRVNPPLREKEDVEFLKQAIKDGFVDCISTDHAPHCSADKENGAPGMVGLETAFSVCYSSLVKSGDISLNKLSELMSKNPAEIIRVNKGLVEKNYDADFVIVDTTKEYTVDASSFVSKSKNSPFDGKTYTGKVLATYKAGKLIYTAENYMEAIL